jgi:hypothetical protein
MIKTLGELKKAMGEAIINRTCDKDPEVFYYRQYTSDPLFVVTISAIHTHEFEKDDAFGNECYADEVPGKLSKDWGKVNGKKF